MTNRAELRRRMDAYRIEQEAEYRRVFDDPDGPLAREVADIIRSPFVRRALDRALPGKDTTR